jgi:pyruvate kinase
VTAGPGVIRWKPERNDLGQVTTLAFVAFYAGLYPPDAHMVGVPVKGAILQHAKRGDIVELTDSRGRERILQVVEVDDSTCVCTNDRTGYVIQGTRLRSLRGSEVVCEDEVGALRELERSLSLSVGDDLVLTPEEVLGHAAVHNEDIIYQPAQIGSLFRGFHLCKAGRAHLF